MRPIKLIVATALFVMLALVGLRVEAQNGSDSSLDESTRAASSSNGGEVEQGGASSRDSNFESRWPPSQFKSLNSQELDEDYDRSGLDKDYHRSGLDEHYDKSGLDEHYDKSGLDRNYVKPGLDEDYDK
jgi:hypothetical protein